MNKKLEELQQKVDREICDVFGDLETDWDRIEGEVASYHDSLCQSKNDLQDRFTEALEQLAQMEPQVYVPSEVYKHLNTIVSYAVGMTNCVEQIRCIFDEIGATTTRGGSSE